MNDGLKLALKMSIKYSVDWMLCVFLIASIAIFVAYSFEVPKGEIFHFSFLIIGANIIAVLIASFITCFPCLEYSPGEYISKFFFKE